MTKILGVLLTIWFLALSPALALAQSAAATRGLPPGNPEALCVRVVSGQPNWQGCMLNGFVITSRVASTAPATAANTDHFLLVDFAAPGVLNLPACADNAGIILRVKQVGAGSVTITPNGAETIDGAASKVLSSQWSALSLVCNTNWFVF